jgi:hypothetical protein
MSCMLLSSSLQQIKMGIDSLMSYQRLSVTPWVFCIQNSRIACNTNRVSLETSLCSKQPNLEPKPALSETKICSVCFASVSKQQVSVFSVKPKPTETNRNKPKTKRKTRPTLLYFIHLPLELSVCLCVTVTLNFS